MFGMPQSFFYFLILLGLFVFGGVALFFWLQNAMTSHRDKEALTAADLRLLQESVETLIQRLKVASDEAVAEIDHRQREMQRLLDRIDDKLAAQPSSKPVALDEISALVEEGLEEAEIARRAGLSRAEVELLLEMQASRQ
jgi:AraC-like DNA-binding protein